MIRAIGVVIPAANEQATIGACLDAVMVARERLRRCATRDIGVRVVVALDGCVDETEAIVEQHRGVESVACSLGRAGAARAAHALCRMRANWMNTPTWWRDAWENSGHAFAVAT